MQCCLQLMLTTNHIGLQLLMKLNQVQKFCNYPIPGPSVFDSVGLVTTFWSSSVVSILICKIFSITPIMLLAVPYCGDSVSRISPNRPKPLIF